MCICYGRPEEITTWKVVSSAVNGHIIGTICLCSRCDGLIERTVHAQQDVPRVIAPVTALAIAQETLCQMAA